MRRALAIVLTLMLATVNVAGALACDDTAISRNPAQADAAPVGHEHHAPAPQPDDEPSTDVPCCQAMTSCGSAADLALESSEVPSLIIASDPARGMVTMPGTRHVAPEPPPPRA